MDLDTLSYDEKGLIPAIIIAAKDQKVLMLGYMNRESLLRTISDRCVWFYSRSRECLWKKGETSGNVFMLKTMDVDCDKDSLLLSVEIEGDGVACHTGQRSCFYTNLISRLDD